MQCLACGAEMQLREVVLADIPTMPGFERHTFRCSACPQVARRLVICRAKMPVVDPLVPSAVSEAPTTNLQTGQQAAGVLPNAVEKLQQAALEDQDVTDWLPTVEKLSMALKERAVAARASAWAKTVEKLRSRQMALKERAPTGDASVTIRVCDHRDKHQGLKDTFAAVTCDSSALGTARASAQARLPNPTLFPPWPALQMPTTHESLKN